MRFQRLVAGIAAAVVFVSIPAFASNDNLASAFPLSGSLPITTTGSNVGFTKEGGEPNHAGNPGGASAWWSWTSPLVPQKVTISTVGSDFNTVLAVYTGAAYPLTPVISNGQYQAFNVPSGSQVTFLPASNTTYRIAVDGLKVGANPVPTGNIILVIATPPSNDDFAIASTLSATLPALAGGTNKYASKEAGEPNHAFDPGGDSVWWNWTPAASGKVTISTLGSTFNTTLAVYTGAVVNGLTLVSTNDDYAQTLQSQMTYFASAGTTYRIAVDGSGADSGAISLAITAANPPPNDDFSNAITLNGNPPIVTTGTNFEASLEAGEPVHAGVGAGASVWWNWTPASVAGNVTFSTFGSDFPTVISVYTGGPPVGSVVLVAENSGSPFSQVTFLPVVGTTYRIAVDGNGASSGGNIRLTIANPPPNDAFANSILLSGPLPITTNGSSVFGSKEAGEPNHAVAPGVASVWWSWQPTGAGNVTISTIGSDFDTLLAVYTGNSVGGLTPVASNDDFGIIRQSQVTFAANPANVYRIAVDGKAGSNFGTVGNISLTIASPPANDNVANATAITGILPATVTGSNAFASKEIGEPAQGTPLDNGGSSVWWKWTSNVNGIVTVSTVGSTFPTTLGVYSSPFTLLTPGSQGSAQVTFTATNATTYLFSVDGIGGVSGNITLTLTGPPGNDNFASAFNLTGTLPIRTTGTNVNATKEPGEPAHGGDAGGSSVWWKWTAPGTPGRITVSTLNSDFDTTLGVYTGASVSSLTLVAQNDNIGHFGSFDFGTGAKGTINLTSQVSFTYTPGQQYFIAVDGFAGQTGNISLALGTPPANDNFANATNFSSTLPTGASTSNRYASKEGGEPNHGNDTGGCSLWYTWTSTVTGKVTINTTGSNIDTVLAVYTGSSLASLQLVGQNDDFNGTVQSQITFNAVSGTTYDIAVDGVQGAQGFVSLSLFNANGPGNDNFGSAINLAGALPIITTGTNLQATKEAGEPNHAGQPGGSSVWWSWTAANSGKVTISTAGSNFTTLLAVYTGNTVNALTPIASDPGTTGQVIFNAVAGTNYKIAVDGTIAASGSITLSIGNTPVNDDFANAIVIPSALPFNTSGTNRFGSKETNEPFHAGNAGGSSVWWSWTPASPVRVTVSTAGSNFKSLLAVYTGSFVSSLTPVASDNGQFGQVTFNALGGTQYWIAIDGLNAGSGAATGSIALSLGAPPTNDNYASASVLTGSPPITVTGATNQFASKETNFPVLNNLTPNAPSPSPPGSLEPNHAGNPGGASVWWSWVAPSNQHVIISTFGSSFSTVLAVYRVSSGVLVQVAQNTVFAGNSSQVDFQAVRGTKYFIAVDGVNNGTQVATGTIRLRIIRFALPDLTVTAISNPTPALPLAGTPVSFTATITNLGTADAPINTLGFYLNRATPPIQTSTPDATARGVLGAGATANITFNVIAPAIGSYTAWAFVDQLNEVAESNKSNNAGPAGGLSWMVVPAAPVVTSPLSAGATQGIAFNYTISGSNSPTSFSATNLPAGLSLNTTTGIISGTPAAPGTASVTISASNSGGTGSATLVISVAPFPLPVITSALSFNGTVGVPFSYTIVGTNNSTSFNATGLPAGLSVTTNGNITGTPTVPGTFSVTLSATNIGGTATSTLQLTIAAAPPVITIPPSASGLSTSNPPLAPYDLADLMTHIPGIIGMVGQPFSFTLTAAGAGPDLQFNINGTLPDGLGLIGNTISGTPSRVGAFAVTVTATSMGASAQQPLSFTIVDPNDVDGDGFPDEIEKAYGTSATDPASTPFGGAPAPKPLPSFQLTSLMVKLKTNADMIQFGGFVPTPAGFNAASVSGQRVLVNFCGVLQFFNLDAKGKSSKTDKKNVMTVKFDPKNSGLVFTAKMIGNFNATLVAHGFPSTAATKQIPIAVLLDKALIFVQRPTFIKFAKGTARSTDLDSSKTQFGRALRIR